MLSVLIFFSFLSLAFFFEGLGLPQGREHSFFILTTLPFVLFLKFAAEKKEIIIPKKIAILFILSAILLIPSVSMASNIQNAFEWSLLYLSAFLFFIYAANTSNIEKPLLPFIFSLSLIFSLYSIAARLFSIIPQNGYQFVFPSFGSHNNLGDFLLLPLASLFYLFLNKKGGILYILLSLLLFLFFIFSFSRTAYLSLTVISLLMLLKVSKKVGFFTLPRLFVIILGIVSFIFFFITPKDINNTLLNKARTALREKQGLQDKYFFAARNDYLGQALKSVIEKPFFGVGAGNFSYQSIKYTTKPILWTDSSHNIFLDVFSENGILSGLVFIAIIFLVLQNSKKELLFFVFLAMLLSFQTYYTHRIYSFFILFFVLGGLIYKERDGLTLGKTCLPAGRIPLVLSLLIAFFSFLILFSNIQIKTGNSELALKLYPLNKKAYEPILYKLYERKDKNEFRNILGNYSAFFPRDFEANKFIGYYYYNQKMFSEALPYYERAFETNAFGDFGMTLRIYAIKYAKDKNEAKRFADGIFKKMEKIEEKWSIPNNYRIGAINFCKGIYGTCPYKLD